MSGETMDDILERENVEIGKRESQNCKNREKKQKKRSKWNKEAVIGLILALIPIIGFLIFNGLPFIISVLALFCDVDLYQLGSFSWNNFEGFKVIFSDGYSLGYNDGAAIDASKVSLQGAQITLTNKVDESDTHTVTVEASNAVPEIKGLKVGATYGVTTTAMNGKLKGADFVCDGNAATLKLQFTNGINYANGSCIAELGSDFAVNSIAGNRPVGNLLLTGLNLEGEVWFGATVRLSGAGSSLRYGSMIAIYFGAPGHNWIEIGHPDGVSGATDHNGGVRYYNGKSYSSNSYIMTAEENALLKNNGLRVAICRTTEGNLEVYFVIDGAMKKVVTFENAVTDAITSFGARLNTIYTGSEESEKGWIHTFALSGFGLKKMRIRKLCFSKECKPFHRKWLTMRQDI